MPKTLLEGDLWGVQLSDDWRSLSPWQNRGVNVPYVWYSPNVGEDETGVARAVYLGPVVLLWGVLKK